MKNTAKKILYSYLFVTLIAFFKYGKLPKSKHFFVKKVGGKGEGLFSTQSYKKNDLVFIATGPVRFGIFTGNDCYKFPDWYMVDSGTWIDIKHPYVKVNHSCKPNLGIYYGRCFVALRDIEAGEELNFDYSLTDDEENWCMNKSECLCGEDNCRTWIGPIQNVPDQHFNYSYPYISKYFVNLYKKSRDGKNINA